MEEMVGCYPFDIFKSFFGLFLESFFVLTRSWHTHITTFFFLKKVLVNKQFNCIKSVLI